MAKAFDLQDHLNAGVERIVNSAVKAALKNLKESAFMLKFARASKADVRRYKMKYTGLGNSDLNVSRICMGCMGFGDAKNRQHSWTIDEEGMIHRNFKLLCVAACKSKCAC